MSGISCGPVWHELLVKHVVLVRLVLLPSPPATDLLSASGRLGHDKKRLYKMDDLVIG